MQFSIISWHLRLQGITVTSVAAGAEHSVVSTETGQVYAWGWGRYGNLGDGFCLDRYEPTKVCFIGPMSFHLEHEMFIV
jgi:alpha-tubulin suppressor-like RCC1 family protein